MVFAARLTQRGHKISTMEDLLALYEQSFSDDTLSAISSLPHPTVQKFSVITVAIVGASRRFLAQITRHQNEVKFMSASLQYSNYAGQADFAIPYEVLAAGQPIRELYLKSCQSDMDCYEQFSYCSNVYSISHFCRKNLRPIYKLFYAYGRSIFFIGKR